MLKRTLCALTALYLAGCATQPTPDETAAASQPVTCSNEADCRAKWSRALDWVLQNSSWRIQTQTDLLIETYPGDQYTPLLSYSISRVDGADGTARIEFRAGCQNFLGC